jgi:hypothetical protein
MHLELRQQLVLNLRILGIALLVMLQVVTVVVVPLVRAMADISGEYSQTSELTPRKPKLPFCSPPSQNQLHTDVDCHASHCVSRSSSGQIFAHRSAFEQRAMRPETFPPTVCNKAKSGQA